MEFKHDFRISGDEAPISQIAVSFSLTPNWLIFISR